ncbi:unnamed protein product [Rhizoctonia solani]|uniref:Extracellular membrane protein CFEM domain-containing protein n=1 Tax=Rhizoctonia solani TaxID=456999 RepID=A0A8H3HW62_9AGAM|nr:unnamed protein product [Rhizoctonia solani]
MMSIVSLFLFALFVSTTTAYPTGMYERQVLADVPKPPTCLVGCATQVAQPLTDSCVQTLALCVSQYCATAEHEVATPYIHPYCFGSGMNHTENGVVVIDIPPVLNGALPTTTLVPLSPGPVTQVQTTVIVTEFVTLSDAPPSVIATTTSTSTEVSDATPSMLSTDVSTPTFASATATASTSSIIVESMNSSTTLRSPAAISVYAIISVIIILLILIFVRRWRRLRQRDCIIPSHRRTRGKSFLIDEVSLKRRSFNSAVGSTTKPPPVYRLSLKEEMPLPALPIPTKDSSDPSAGIALSYVPQLAITRTPKRNYTALPGRSPSPEVSPEPEKSFVTQTFAAGRERAITNIRHSREGSRSPTSPSSSISSPSSPNGDMYASATPGPLPAYAYMAPHQPTAPSPLRAQLRAQQALSRVSTIQEEPKTPYGAKSVFSVSTNTMSVLNSKVETAQRVRPTFASHVRGPGSAEKMRQFTFPNSRQSLNETELQITISEALMDDGVPVSRSQTPNGSMYRGAGGSVSSISKVQGKLQALVGGMRRERD